MFNVRRNFFFRHLLGVLRDRKLCTQECKFLFKTCAKASDQEILYLSARFLDICRFPLFLFLGVIAGKPGKNFCGKCSKGALLLGPGYCEDQFRIFLRKVYPSLK